MDEKTTLSSSSVSQENLGDMTLIEHIRDLRNCVLRSFIGIFLGMLVCWTFSERLLNEIRRPIEKYLQGGGLVFTGPMDGFMAHIRVSLIGGVMLTSPVWLYQVWRFIAPALHRNEKKLIFWFIFSGGLQFLLGTLFCYYIVFPGTFEFLMGFGGGIDKPMITISSYLEFFTQTILIFGVVFEIPVIISFLGLMGLVSSKFLREKRRFAIVINAIVAAIAAPPDVFSMLMLLLPLMVMYEISIRVILGFEHKRMNEGMV